MQQNFNSENWLLLLFSIFGTNMDRDKIKEIANEVELPEDKIDYYIEKADELRNN